MNAVKESITKNSEVSYDFMTFSKSKIQYDIIVISKVIPNEIFISQEHLKEAFNSTAPSLSVSDVERYKHL